MLISLLIKDSRHQLRKTKLPILLYLYNLILNCPQIGFVIYSKNSIRGK